MKNGKSFIRVLLAVVMLLCAMCFVACGQGNAGDNGTYYLYENGQLDKSSFIKLDGEKWSDDDNERGTYSISGDTVTIYVEIEGEKEEFAKGTLKDGVLTLTIMGETVVYCQEGKTPSKPSNPSEPSEPDKFTVSFNANDGTFADNTSILKSEDVKKGGFVEEPASPTRDGYIFAGWSVDKNSENLWNFGENQVNEDLTLYAVWTRDDGHSITSAAGFEISDITLKTITISLDGTYDLRDRFAVSKGATWRAFSSVECAQPTEITKRIATIEYGWNDVYVLVENQTTYESTVYNLKIYRAPVSSLKLKKDNTYEISKGIDFAEVILPSEYDGKIITTIGQSAFEDCSGLTSITIPDSVTSIGNLAFSGCSGLTSITIPDSVTSIGSSAFYKCSGLTSVTIGNSVTSIGGAFSGCTSLVSIVIPDSVTSIGSAFSGCTSLVSIVIPDSVTSIGAYAFEDCRGLEIITIPNSVTSIEVYAFRGCSGLTSITIPDGVTSIGSSAFSGCSGLTSITIPDSVTSIGSSVFEDCSGLTEVIWNAENCTEAGSSSYPIFKNCNNLVQVTIGGNVKTVPSYAFYGCSKLTSVIIPDNVTSIGKSAFEDCRGLEIITIPNSVTSIEDYAFRGCSGLTSITIPDGVTSIGSSAFSGCSGLTSITIPDGVTSIGDYEFRGCSKLTSITIPDSVTSIGKDAFSGCSKLTSITIPDSVTSIGKDAFYGCKNLKYNEYDKDLYLGNESNPYVALIKVESTSIISCTINGNCKIIYYSAFSGCRELTSITIPDSVISIGDYAFSGCSGLTEVIWNAENCTNAGSSNYPAFEKCANLTSITIGDNVKTIPSYAFEDCSELKYNEYDNGLYLGNGNNPYIAFIKAKSTNITSCTINANCKIVCSSAFYYCSRLTTITIPDSVTSIGSYAFEGCTNLKYNEYDNALYLGNESNPYVALVKVESTGITTCTINENCKIICYSAFSDCVKLTSITIPDSVTSIGWYAFGYCVKLTSITIPDSVTSIDRSAFLHCCGLTSITIGNGVTSIGIDVFGDCDNLTSIVIPDSVTSIKIHAFYGCSGLQEIHFNGTIAQWKKISKDYKWAYKVPSSCKVICTDGETSL